MRRLGVALLILLWSGTCFAESYWMTSPTTNKFKRGAVNVVSAPLEIPKEVVKGLTESKNNPVDKLFYLVGGTFKGAALMVMRAGSGLWDMVSCNLDFPPNREPLLKPNYVFSKENASKKTAEESQEKVQGK